MLGDNARKVLEAPLVMVFAADLGTRKRVALTGVVVHGRVYLPPRRLPLPVPLNAKPTLEPSQRLSHCLHRIEASILIRSTNVCTHNKP